MNKLEKFLAVVIGVLLITVAFRQTYLAGQNSWKAYSNYYDAETGYHSGYADGWADAMCGKGKVCEAGQQ